MVHVTFCWEQQAGEQLQAMLDVGVVIGRVQAGQYKSAVIDNYLFSGLSLGVIVVVDTAPILRAHVHTLPVLCGWVHICKEAIQQGLIGALAGVVVELQYIICVY